VKRPRRLPLRAAVAAHARPSSPPQPGALTRVNYRVDLREFVAYLEHTHPGTSLTSRPWTGATWNASSPISTARHWQALRAGARWPPALVLRLLLPAGGDHTDRRCS